MPPLPAPERRAYRLEIETMDLGADVRALGLGLAEAMTLEPATGAEAARIWACVLRAVAGEAPWALDFFSHLDRVRSFCEAHGIAYRQAAARCVVIHEPDEAALDALLARFEAETFGVRAGERLDAGDPALENELARRGVDAYHAAFPNYLFCAVCEPERGSWVLLSNALQAEELAGLLESALGDLRVEIIPPE